MAEVLSLKRVSGAVVRRSAAVIRQGGVILYPTDTIYGLGCSAFNEEAIKRVFRIKQRAETNPMLILIRDVRMLEGLVTMISPFAARLMKQFWPGPLTLILPANDRVCPLLTASGGTIGVRIPDNDFCKGLMRESGVPLVSTSANISSQTTPNDILSLKETFFDKVDLIIDAGDTLSSQPSTIVDATRGKARIVRQGKIRTSEILSCLRGRIDKEGICHTEWED